VTGLKYMSKAMGSLDGPMRHIVIGRKTPLEFTFKPNNDEIAEAVVKFALSHGVHIAFYNRTKSELIHVDSDNPDLNKDQAISHLALAIFNRSNLWFDSEQDMKFFLINFSEHFQSLTL
jgi:hypothetical protein